MTDKPPKPNRIGTWAVIVSLLVGATLLVLAAVLLRHAVAGA